MHSARQRSAESLLMADKQPLPPEIDCQTVASKLGQEGQFLLIDCREPDEHALVHIEGAMLLPMSQIGGRLEELKPYAEHEIAVHCHQGGRSLRVSNWLRDNGFPKSQSMAGGIDEWSLKINPTLPRY